MAACWHLPVTGWWWWWHGNESALVSSSDTSFRLSPCKWSVVQLVPSKVNSRTVFHLWLNGCCEAKRFFNFQLTSCTSTGLAKTARQSTETNAQMKNDYDFLHEAKSFSAQNSLIKWRKTKRDTTNVFVVISHATKRWNWNNFDASKSLWKHKLCACMLTTEDFVILSCRTSIYEVAISADALISFLVGLLSLRQVAAWHWPVVRCQEVT